MPSCALAVTHTTDTRVAAKRRASRYLAGAGSNDRLKIKRPGGTPPERFERQPLEWSGR